SGRSKSSVWVAMASPPGPPLRIAERGRDGRSFGPHEVDPVWSQQVAQRPEQLVVHLDAQRAAAEANGADAVSILTPSLPLSAPRRGGWGVRLPFDEHRCRPGMRRTQRRHGPTRLRRRGRERGPAQPPAPRARRDPRLLRAPLAQRGGGARPEKLHLGAVAVQWMPGNEEPEHGLLAGEPFVLGPGRDIGVRGSGLGARGFFAEESVLARLP